MNIEIAELMNKDGKMMAWASKVSAEVSLNEDEVAISEVVDKWARDIGNRGCDPNCEIAEFVRRTVVPEVYDAADEILSLMFNRGSVGEFDIILTNKTPKNTLKAYLAGKGGNVDKSYIDWEALTTKSYHTQIETEISYEDLRRNGYKSVANLTTFALQSFTNDMVSRVFDILDDAVTGSTQVFAITSGGALTKEVADKLSLYTLDNATTGDEPICVGLTKYAQQLANMSGYTSFMSDEMKNRYNKRGLVEFYGGMNIKSISSAMKTADGSNLVPANRLFGISGKIGNLDQRGDVRIYETADNNKEVINLKFTGFQFDVTITDASKVAKVTFA